MRILIVKLSSLGDVVHAMAALQDLRRALPDAQIDWVVERGFAPLVRRCQGVNRVISCDLRHWRKAPFSRNTRQAWCLFKADLQQESYDAVLDLQGLSKSAWVAWLARLSGQGQRIAMANQTEGSSYEAPTRWLAQLALTLPRHIHAVDRARQMCAMALHYTPNFELSFGLSGHADIASVATENRATLEAPPARVALVHGTSRADKEWPLAQWRALASQLNEAGFAVLLPHGNDAEERTAHAIADGLLQAQVLPRLGLDALTDVLASCVGVIGVDSGVSHIAVALDLPHVQIYNFDTAWRTGPQTPRQCSVFAQPTPAVEAVWQAWLSVSQKVYRA